MATDLRNYDPALMYGSTVTSAGETVNGNSTVTGSVTQNGGEVNPSNTTTFWGGSIGPTLATMGNDTAGVNGTRWWIEVFVPTNCTLTGIGYLIGATGGTDKVIVELHDTSGAILATSALAGVTVGTAANFQLVPFTATYTAISGRYFLVVQTNGTTATIRTHTIPALSIVTGNVAGTFGTSASITPGTTYTANKGPVACTY